MLVEVIKYVITSFWIPNVLLPLLRTHVCVCVYLCVCVCVCVRARARVCVIIIYALQSYPAVLMFTLRKNYYTSIYIMYTFRFTCILLPLFSTLTQREGAL